MKREAEVPVILLVEDQPDDVLLMRLALKAAGLEHPFFAVYDGYEAIEYFKGTGQYADREKYPVPALLMLDIKMPGMDGFGVLKWLQGRPEREKMAVVMLTSSDLEPDRARAKKLGADDYLVKPNSHAERIGMMKFLGAMWLGAQEEGNATKRAVRNVDTGMFYANGDWTALAEFAQDFPDRESALKVVMRLKIAQADLVYLSARGRIIGGEAIRIAG